MKTSQRAFPGMAPLPEPAKPEPRWKREAKRPVKRMWRLFGLNEKRRCRRCKHIALRPGAYNVNVLRCIRYARPGNAPNADPLWSAGWRACGLWEDRGYDYV